MEKIIGFIGYGNMAQAISKGIIESKVVPVENIIASKSKISNKGKIGDKFDIYYKG